MGVFWFIFYFVFAFGSFSIGIELDFVPVRRAKMIFEKNMFLIHKNGPTLKVVCFENFE